jgi:hypothetical protein
VATVTITALLAAGAGYVGAGVLRDSRVTGALVGAFLGGGVAAVVQYSNYLVEKANNDRLLAMDLLNNAVTDDRNWLRQNYADINKEMQGLQDRVAEVGRKEHAKEGHLADLAADLREVKQKISGVEVSADVFLKAAPFYADALPIVSDGRTDPPMVEKRTIVEENISAFNREASGENQYIMANLRSLSNRGVF